MRLETELTEAGAIWRVHLRLQEAEARELRDALEDMLTEGVSHTGWHAHVLTQDYQTEVTVCWDLPE